MLDLGGYMVRVRAVLLTKSETGFRKAYFYCVCNLVFRALMLLDLMTMHG
jgi:hypothetical protein